MRPRSESASRSAVMRPSSPGGTSELSIATVDGQGRLALRRPARRAGWYPGQTVVLTVDGGVLRLADPAGSSAEVAGIVVVLDDRHRAQVPYGVRVMTGMLPGVQVLVLVTSDRDVAAIPVFRLVKALARDESD
jgi:hypothetical protein